MVYSKRILILITYAILIISDNTHAGKLLLLCYIFIIIIIEKIK